MDLWASDTNNYNLNFYKNLGIDPFKDFAEIGGFNTYTDLELIYPSIENSKSLLELGAGYGRCIEYLLKKSFQGQIIAVEYCPDFFSYLRERFPEEVIIIKEDIKNLSLPTNIDTALWMWSGIVDFSKSEQQSIIKNISKMLSDKGKLIIDIPKEGIKTIAMHKDEKHLLLDTVFGRLYCYMPSVSELEEFAMKGNFSNITSQHYYTSKNKERTIFTFHK